MAKFCKKCGSRLDEISGRCPKCDMPEAVNRPLASRPPVNGQPTNRPPANGQPVNRSPVANRPPVNGQPANRPPVNGQPTNRPPANGQPVNRSPVANRSPVNGQPANRPPVNGRSANSHPVNGQPANRPSANRQQPEKYVKQQPPVQLTKKEQKKQDRKDKKKQKKAQMSIGQKIKRFFVKMIAVIAVLSIFSGCCVVALVYFNVLDIPFISEILNTAEVKISQRKNAKEIEEAFKNDDVDKINLLIFGDNTIKLNDDTDFEIDLNNSFDSNGLIGYILKKSTVVMSKKEDDTITYKVTAPDMSGVFNDTSSIQTSDELLQHIMDYADKAELVEKEVTVGYIVSNNELKIDYQTVEFVDAILGGLISAYQNLYQNALDEAMQ